jgi:plastocyanin domain-containing protein
MNLMRRSDMMIRMKSRTMALGCGALLLLAVAAHAAATSRAGAQTTDIPRVSIEATGNGFAPDTVRLPVGAPADLVFTRTTTSGCMAQVHIPDFGIGRTALALGEPVVIRVTPEKAGSYEFRCGMDMHRGVIIVAPRR